MRQNIEFGSSFIEIARRFKERMDEFNGYPGALGPDKFLKLGEHVYNCAATSLDRCLSQHKVPTTQEIAVAEISVRLKKIANYDLREVSKDYRVYWAEGTKVAEELMILAQAAEFR
ncbi:MAG: hypothetical protein ACE5KM_09470 [Planctomycetaceae bacterium]